MSGSGEKHMSLEIEVKREAARAILRPPAGVLIALSGGVDSVVLLALAVEALGAERVLAVTGASEAVPVAEVEDARRASAALGVRHEVVRTRELERLGYAANAGDRCYHCREELFDVLEGVRRREGLGAVAYGAIVDDLADDRPGMRAAAKRGILAPLLEAGLTKNDVRALAADLGLEVRDKPASPCLSSRIPAGTPVTSEKLTQIDRAESALKALGLRQLRVRHHGDVARIEVDEAGLTLLAQPAARAEAVRAVKAAGFRFVALDLEAFRSGRSSAAEVGDAPPREPRPGPLHSILPARERGQ